MLPDAGWCQGFQFCMQAELPNPVHFEMQYQCYIIADPGDVLDVDLHIMMHGEECEGTDQGHHGLAASGGLGHNMHYRCIITMRKQALPS